MNSYSERCIFRAADVAAWRRACAIVEALPGGVVDGDELRCHEVARVVRQVLQDARFGLYDVVDGKYGAVNHSWISCVSAPGRWEAVLDPYAPGRMPQCQLIDPGVPGVAFPYRKSSLRELGVTANWSLVDALIKGLPEQLRREA